MSKINTVLSGLVLSDVQFSSLALCLTLFSGLSFNVLSGAALSQGYRLLVFMKKAGHQEGIENIRHTDLLVKPFCLFKMRVC